MDRTVVNRYLSGAIKRPKWERAKWIASKLNVSPAQVMEDVRGVLLGALNDNS